MLSNPEDFLLMQSNRNADFSLKELLQSLSKKEVCRLCRALETQVGQDWHMQRVNHLIDTHITGILPLGGLQRLCLLRQNILQTDRNRDMSRAASGIVSHFKHILMQAKVATERLQCDTNGQTEDKVCLWPLQQDAQLTSAIGLPTLQLLLQL